MTRIIFIIGFLFWAQWAGAQTQVPGTALPRDPVAAEVAPMMIILSQLSPWRAVEVVGLTVGAVEVAQHMRPAESEYGARSIPTLRLVRGPRFHFAGARRTRTSRATLIHRYY